MVEFAVQSYADIISIAMPIAIVYAIGDLLVGTILRVAFGGRLWFGK